MKQSLRIALRVMLLGGVTFAATQAEAQLKVGTNPTKIQKSAVLELESKKQGLLLTRLDNFTDIDALNPPDGMIVFLNTADATKGLYVRKDGQWVKVASSADATGNWNLKGNKGDANYFIGTTDNFPLIFKSNNDERFRITEDGHLQTAPGAVDAGTGELDVLVLKNDGTILKRTLSRDVFGKAVQSLNNLDGALTLDANVTTANNDFTITNDGASKITINAPIMNGGATQQYGFLSLADWKKLQTLGSAAWNVGTLITAAAGTDLDKGARITYDNATNKYNLELIAADETHAGIVTTAAQNFAGEKTFKGRIIGEQDVVFGKKLNVNGDFSTLGNASLGANATVSGTLKVSNDVTLDKKLTLTTVPSVTDNTWVLLRNQTDNSVSQRQLPASAFETALHSINNLVGPDINFVYDKIGNDVKFTPDATQTPNQLKLTIPDASAVNLRGLVTNDAQNFGGVKKFADSLYTRKSLMVGDTLIGANSTLTVAGSVSMPIRTVTGDATVSASDYTVIVKSGSAAHIKLPAANNIAGRIYTIKKVPATAGPGNDTNIDNTVFVEAAGGDTIEDGASVEINNDWTFITVQSDGKNTWYIIKK